MTIEMLLEKARKNAVQKTYEWYLNICDGDKEETAEFIEEEKETGTYTKSLERITMDNIYVLIRTIKKTSLMSDEEKELAIQEIKRCPEYQKTEKDVAMIFANHFYRYKDVYLK